MQASLANNIMGKGDNEDVHFADTVKGSDWVCEGAVVMDLVTGEAACWDLHGFNRLGGNSVAETVVSGIIVGEYVADYAEK